MCSDCFLELSYIPFFYSKQPSGFFTHSMCIHWSLPFSNCHRSAYSTCLPEVPPLSFSLLGRMKNNAGSVCIQAFTGNRANTITLLLCSNCNHFRHNAILSQNMFCLTCSSRWKLMSLSWLSSIQRSLTKAQSESVSTAPIQPQYSWTSSSIVYQSFWVLFSRALSFAVSQSSHPSVLSGVRSVLRLC